MDFTIDIYKELLNALISQAYTFQTFEDFIQKPASKAIILRHDVDARKHNSFDFAKIQKSLDIKGTYYFRTVAASFNEKIIRDIHAMGHEIGYHYETMDTSNGKIDKAYAEFLINLKMFRAIVPIKTICMHGSPLSKYDNKDIWKKYDYKALGLIAEPYCDLDFDKVFYITDTGRRWDGAKFSVRDKVNSSAFNLSFHATRQIIDAANSGELPQQIMLTFHPQRWTNSKSLWIQELLMQNVKNIAKNIIVK